MSEHRFTRSNVKSNVQEEKKLTHNASSIKKEKNRDLSCGETTQKIMPRTASEAKIGTPLPIKRRIFGKEMNQRPESLDEMDEIIPPSSANETPKQE